MHKIVNFRDNVVGVVRLNLRLMFILTLTYLIMEEIKFVLTLTFTLATFLTLLNKRKGLKRSFE